MRRRLQTLTGLLAAILALSASAAPAAGPSAPPETRQCSLGRLVLQSWLPKDPDQWPSILLIAAPIGHGSMGSHQNPLATQWSREGPSNLFVACPQLRALVPPGVYFASQADYANLGEVKRTADQPYVYINGFTAPVLNAAGTEGVVLYVAACPGLCGQSVLRRYEWRKGAWVHAEILTMSIS